MSKIENHRLFLLVFAALSGLTLVSTGAEARDLSSYARGMSFGVAYVDTWDSSCGCSGLNLKYTGKQMYYLQRVLRSYSADRRFYFSNSSANPTDLIEDAWGGRDNSYGDSVSLYAYSGHGGRWGSIYQITMCKSRGVCTFSSGEAVWGETSNYDPFGTVLKRNINDRSDISRYPGNLRWVMLTTCHSVEGNPYDVWRSASEGTRLEFIMGYSGTSKDSSYTDEVPEDWAENVFEDGMTFKAGWFSAAEDWWINDTAGAVAFGNTRAEANNRLKYQRVNYSRRTASTAKGSWARWAWHKG